MQIISVSNNPFDFYTKFKAVAEGIWFDSVTFTEGSSSPQSIINCYIGEELALEFSGIYGAPIVTMHTSNSSVTYTFGGGSPETNFYFNRITATDNAVVVTSTPSNSSMIICRDSSDNVCVCAFVSESSCVASSSTAMVKSMMVRKLMSDDAKFIVYYFQNDADARSTYAVQIPAPNDLTIKDVYACLVRPYPEDVLTQKLSINGTGYAAIANCSYLIETSIADG